MAESFPTMNGGDGALSYAKNSQFQKDASDFVKAMIHEAIIEKLDADISSTVVMVDLGCSVGPNTFFTAQNMIQALEKKSGLPQGIEFEVFFNDQAANDFNTLFASLPPPPHRQYYAAGVPGSFHGRLFPRARITLVHSSFSLHFLSKVPEEITDSKSTSWNHGRIHYTTAGGASRDVVKSYSHQFGRDMEVFLRSRAEEIVRGGLMFLTIPGIADGLSPLAFYALSFNLLESSLFDLANEGVIDEGEIDAFNLPIYFPIEGEMTKLIEENGCFSIERVEVTIPRSKISARAVVMHLRAGLEGLITQQFGDCVMEKMFAKSLAKAEEASDLFEASLHDSAQLFYVLKRK